MLGTPFGNAFFHQKIEEEEEVQSDFVKKPTQTTHPNKPLCAGNLLEQVPCRRSMMMMTHSMSREPRQLWILQLFISRPPLPG